MLISLFALNWVYSNFLIKNKFQNSLIRNRTFHGRLSIKKANFDWKIIECIFSFEFRSCSNNPIGKVEIQQDKDQFAQVKSGIFNYDLSLVEQSEFLCLLALRRPSWERRKVILNDSGRVEIKSSNQGNGYQLQLKNRQIIFINFEKNAVACNLKSELENSSPENWLQKIRNKILNLLSHDYLATILEKKCSKREKKLSIYIFFSSYKLKFPKYILREK